MISVLRVARAVALGGVLGACGQISGLSDYTAGEPGADAATLPGAHPAPEAGVDATARTDASGGGDAAEAAADASVGSDATEAAADASLGTDAVETAADALGGDGAMGVADSSGAGSDATGEEAEAGCAIGLVACDSGCLDPSSPSSCGSCNNACAGGTPVCAASGGTYACTSGCPTTAPTLCGGTCVDPLTDINNCGGCGSAYVCASSQTCSSGHCFGCGTNCPVSVVSGYLCAKGGCNTSGGACTTAATACYCTSNSQCASGTCAKVAGQNDVSCGSSCTITAAAHDGFDCILASPGIPAACAAPTFGYTPSNFAPASYTPPATSTTIDCNPTYSSSTHAFTGWCAGQTAPTIYSSVAQAGGHSIDILAFRSLTLDPGNTLTLTGSNPVILAVHGTATISGVIDASANGTTPGAGGNNCAAASNGTASTQNYWEPGAGGGGQAAAGGAGGNSEGNNTPSPGGAAGSAHGTGTVPLTGGCAGGLPHVSNPNLGYSPAVGAGGGGVQISAADLLDVTGGTIKANGSNGGPGEVGTCTGTTQDGTGGAGGGSGGTILLEGSTVNAGTYQATGGAGGAGGTSNAPNGHAGGPGGPGGAAGAAGTIGGPGLQTSPTPGGSCNWPSNWSGGGGGGGAGGWTKTSTGAAPVYACTTSLSPAPVCSGTHTACLCVADSDCSSGQCSNASSQCTGTCTGPTAAGRYDAADCALVTSAASKWSCSAGNCNNVASPSGACPGPGVPCWCTADAQCAGGLCVNWAGCPAGACTASGAPDGFHCAP